MTSSPRCRWPCRAVATGESAVTDSGIHGFWVTIGIFVILAVVHVVVTLLDIYVTQRFIMRWRVWLSGRLIDDWLGDFAYFRRQFLRRPNDNPDQRIQQDIDIFTTGVGGQPNNPTYDSGHTLLFGAVAAVLSVFVVRRDPLASVRAADAGRRRRFRARCSGSSSSTCWPPPSSPSGSAGR